MGKKTVYDGQVSKVAWVLGIIGGFVPLIVRLKAIKIPPVGVDIWDNGTGLYADFFSANKVIALGILTMLAVALLVWEYKQGMHAIERKNANIIYNNRVLYILLAAYLLLALISTLLADKESKVVTLLGSPGRYEGLITIVFYIVIMLISITIGKEKKNIRLIYRIVAAGSFLLGLIGIGQFFGWDLLQSDGGKALMLPFKYQNQAADINFAFAGRVYATLFNPNYVGSYAAMLMPISLTAVIYTYSSTEGKEKKFKASVLALLMLALWLTSYSRGGLLGGSFALIIIIITLNKGLMKTKGRLSILIALTLVGGIGLNIMSKGAILKRIQSLPSQAKSFISSDQADIPQLTDIRLEEDAVEIDSNLPTFRIELKTGELIMKDQQGSLVDLKEKKKKYTPKDKQFSGMDITLHSEEQFTITIKNPDQKARYSIYLVHTPAGMQVVGHGNKTYDIVSIPSWGFKGKEKLGSSRGYIWSRTIPMIKNKWLFGYGLDTYAINFPQHDIVGKINAYGRTNIITDKPHNLYLQTMVATGVPSMLMLVAVFIIYTIRHIKYIKVTAKDDIRRWMSIGIFSAICGYLVAGFFNDSVVSVAPVFWVLWGLGIGLTSLPSPKKEV